jgi:hypothetical protein
MRAHFETGRDPGLHTADNGFCFALMSPFAGFLTPQLHLLRLSLERILLLLLSIKGLSIKLVNYDDNPEKDVCQWETCVLRWSAEL